MGQEERIQRWEEAQQQTFHDFIVENIGFEDDEDRPAYYESGDSNPWCSLCKWQATC